MSEVIVGLALFTITVISSAHVRGVDPPSSSQTANKGVTFAEDALPRRRPFLSSIANNDGNGTRLRVLQFNMLADGLSGLRPDQGAFSRVVGTELLWDRRREQILQEVTQYAPDLVTMQELDHCECLS
jgi:mRNA deadenylase 3'-5' endonuclease subunit Ccr4